MIGIVRTGSAPRNRFAIHRAIQSITDDAYGISSSPVNPDGSNRVYAILSQIVASGAPCCNAMDTMIDQLSNSPESVAPVLDIFTKTSPGVPSSNSPTVT
jgi:hypothetical protein